MQFLVIMHMGDTKDPEIQRKRAELRAEHLKRAATFRDKGHVIIGGATLCARDTTPQASSTTWLRSTPISGTSTSTTSPGLSHFGGLWWPPAPVGVPVQIRSPGSSVAKVEM